MIKILSADDHPLLREGLKHILMGSSDIEIAGEVDNGFDLIEKLRKEAFDMVLLDMFMPGKSGIELIKQLKSEFPKTRVLVLSSHKEDIYAVRTIKAGASGYLCKDYAAEALVEAIRKVAHGGVYVSTTVAELLAQQLQAPKDEVLPHTLLTDREFQVFMLAAAGKGTTDIANELHLSAKTVSTHKTRIKEKMRLENDADITRYALRHQLLVDDSSPSGSV